MNNEDDNNKSKVKADKNGIAIGGINIGGDISGTIQIGHTTGYTPEEVSVLITQIQSTFQSKPFDGHCPYKGLDVFEEEDAELFFGREKLVNDLVSRVKESRTVFVTGPSGSGKSSLVRAGLIHALKQGAIKGSERWLYATMKPGRDPIGELGRVISSLAGTTNAEDEINANAMKDATIFVRWCEIALKEGRDKRLVLFIDQFEEVFTQISKEEERVAFLNLLTHAATVANGRVIILFSMRSDFVSNCATYPQLNALLNQQFVQIGAMQPEELVSAIAQPALRVGLRIDPDLIAQIINEMKGEPGALPLMQFALKDLFDSQGEKNGVIALTLNDYLQRGGIHKALERHADDSFSKLSKSEQELARSIFSGLIEIGRGTQDTKRTALFDELIPANTKAEDVEVIVQKLADARLITTDEQAGKETVTISHEKLIDAWPWLKKLVNENRDVITLQNQISTDAKEWQERKRDASYLYTGGRLASVREQFEKQKIGLSHLAQEFVRAGKARQRRGQALLISAVSVVLIAAIVASVVFQNQAQISKANAVEAIEQAKIALTRQLAAQAQSLFATGYSKQIPAVLLAIQSMQLIPSIEAAQILQTNSLPRQVASIMYGNTMNSIAFSSDGKYMVSGGCDQVNSSNNCTQGSTRVSKADTGEEISHVTYDSSVNSVALSLDGKYAVSGSTDKTAHVLKADTGKEISHMTHDGEVSSVAFSPNGKYVASGGCYQPRNESCAEGVIRIWEASTGKETARMIHNDHSIDHYDVVVVVVFSSDGKYLISYGGTTAIVWDASTGKEISRMMHDGFVLSVAFSPDSKYIVSGGSDGTARVWEAATGEEIIRMIYGDVVSSVAFSPDGNYVVLASYTDVHVWETNTGKEVAHMTHDGHVNSVAFSPDGKYVVSGSNDKTARVWEASTGKEISRMTHDSSVAYVAFSPDGKYVVSRGGTTAIVWETRIRNEVARMTHESYVNFVAFSPDGKYVVSGSGDGIYSVWETRTGKEIFRMPYGDNSVVFSPNSKYIVSINVNTVQVRELSTGIEIAHMTHDSSVNYGVVNSVAFSPDSKYVVSGSFDNTARVWEVTNGKEVARMSHGNVVRAVAFSADSKYVVSTSDDNTIRVWEATTGKELVHITHSSSVNSIAFSRDGKYVISGSSNNTIFIWDARTGKEISHITDEGDTVWIAVVLSPDGKYIAVKGCDTLGNPLCAQGFVRVWDVDTGKEIAHMTHDGEVWSIAFSPDGKYLVSGSSDNTARVWEISTSKEIARMTHDGWVWSVAFSPDGKYVISGGCDKQDGYTCAQAGSTRVWEAATGKEIARMMYGDMVNSVAFSPDGKYVVSGSQDKTARVWIYRSEDLIAEACSRVTRNLTQAEWNQYIGDALPYQAVCPNLPIEAESTPMP